MATTTQYWCDGCKCLMEDNPRRRWELPIAKGLVLIKVDNSVNEDFHLCPYCVADAVVNALDDRPKEGR